MGFKDRLQKLKEGVSSSPIDVRVIEQGNPETLYAGQPATLNVMVKGEDDGATDRIEVFLHLSPSYESFKLGEVPPVAGLQQIQVDVPGELQPSVATYSEYSLRAKVFRKKGLNDEGTMPIDVVGRPESLHWPKGPRSGQDGGTDAVRVDVILDQEVVNTSDSLTGTVRVVAARDLGKEDIVLTIGTTTTSARQNDKNGRRELRGTVELAKKQQLTAGQHLDLPFKVEIPEGAPPTFGYQDTTIIWRAEASVGKAVGWTIFGVLDPNADAGLRSRKAQGLAGLMTGSVDV